ncbi:MAG: hypothetical protein EXS31_03680 [Pedosphaera sp.]|nr:hypothetical protein [Pedosphaera sp.]
MLGIGTGTSVAKPGVLNATRIVIQSCFFLFAGTTAHALTVAELAKDASLTPRTFAHHFANFRFRFDPKVQQPDAFLSARAGDCDDYAILAARVLKSRGFTPRLISVRMPHEVDVVCYVEEVEGYLDFNERKSGDGIVRCANSLETIAAKVTGSFDAEWEYVCEFVYRDGVKRLVRGVNPKNREASAKPSNRNQSQKAARS